jgi:hypothetical protein
VDFFVKHPLPYQELRFRFFRESRFASNYFSSHHVLSIKLGFEDFVLVVGADVLDPTSPAEQFIEGCNFIGRRAQNPKLIFNAPLDGVSS